MAKLKTLKEAGEATGIGVSTIRKYVSEFPGLIPVEKGPRNALMFNTKGLNALKTVKAAYQAKMSKEQITAKLQGKRVVKPKAAKPAAKKATRKPKTVAPVAQKKELGHEETIMKGYEDQQADQGFW